MCVYANVCVCAQAFSALIADPKYGGTVYSLTPDFGDGARAPLIDWKRIMCRAGKKNPNLITSEKCVGHFDVM